MSNATQILLVEDDRHIALALRIRLSAAGYDVVIACSVAESLSAVVRSLPEIAVIDINLPDGNGIDLMYMIAQQAQDRTVPSIIMTASRKPGLRELALQNGAAAYLEKPFPSTDLLEAIAKYLTCRKAS